MEKKTPKEPNPFSFQNFTASKGTAAASSPPFPDLPSVGKEGKKEKDDIFKDIFKDSSSSAAASASTTSSTSSSSSAALNAGSGEPRSAKSGRRKEENPFSFKNFVKEDGLPPSNPPQTSQKTGKSGQNNNGPTIKTKVGPALDSDEDDFDDSDSEITGHGPPPFIEKSAPPIIARTGRNDDDDSDFSDSDNPLVAKPVKQKVDDILEMKNREIAELRVKLEKLSVKSDIGLALPDPEISDLKAELQKQKSRAEQAEKRVLALEKKFEAHKQKEKLETEALEKMVKDVEQTLSQTTTRAIQAENTSARLQAELKKTLAELEYERSKNSNNANNRNYTTPADFGPYAKDNVKDIHQRVNTVSHEITMVSENAKAAIQMLLSQAHALDSCAFTLKNLDRVTEINDK